MLVDDLYEDLELWYPKLRLEEEECKQLPPKGGSFMVSS
jgi:hypothetical protein